MPNKRSEEQFINPKTGVFTELGPGDYDDDEEEEDDNDIQFLDYREINGMGEGKSFVKSKRTKKQRGWLVNPLVTSRPGGRDRIQACAPFHYTDPWWKITMLRTTQGRGHTVYLKDMFALSYELRHDANCSKQKVVFMFLAREFEHDDNIHECLTAFESYLRQTGLTDSLTFDNIEDILKRFEKSLPEAEKFKALKLQNRFYTRAGRHIHLAKKYPRIFQYIPQLLPNQFLTILDVDEEIIEELDDDLVERPWIFGFKQALYADRDLIGCEAPWIALIRAGFRDKIKNPYKDALIIYDYLKEDSKRNGHTCRELGQLRNTMMNKVTNFTEALKWLKKKKVVKELLIYGKFCIFLYGLYKCEENITKGINTLFLQPGGEQLELNIDLQSEEFASIRTDREQLRAAEMIKVNPVVVISGKGGCGKTTVVTKVLSNSDLPKWKIENSKVDEDENVTDDKSGLNSVNANGNQFKKPGVFDTKNPEDIDGELEDKTSENEKMNIRSSNQEHILYTAPTGKAANLLGRRANTTGYTLHQIIWSYRRFVSESKKNPEEQMVWRFHSKSTLVVDECSLVSVKTFSTLLKILMENAKLSRIILLGDIRQLPSIEPGNFLSDVFQSLRTRGCAIELQTNHRAESQLIIDNATRISLQQYPKMDPEQNFKFHRVPEDETNKTDFTDTVVQRMLKSEAVLESDKTSQFVAFTRNNCQWINSVACGHYNKHPLKDEKNKLIFQPGDKVCMTKNGQVRMYEKQPNGQFQPIKEENTSSERDDETLDQTLMSATQCPTQVSHVRGANKVNARRNGLNISSNDSEADNTENATPDEEERKFKAIRLCNGEIFFIIGDHEVYNPTGKPKMTRYVQLTDYDKEEPKEIWVDFHELMKECVMRHAWARTIHTYQGSESEAVIYVVGTVPLNFGQNWQHVYTAVTRGRKAVHIVGTERNLIRAVTKKEDKRNTGLKYLLINTLPKRDLFNQSICVPDAANLTVPLDRSQVNNYAKPGPSHQSVNIEMRDSEEYTTSFVNSENSHLLPLLNSKNQQSVQPIPLNSNYEIAESENSNDSNQSESLLSTGKYSNAKGANSEDSNDSNQSELLLQTGQYSSDKAGDSADSNDSNQSELLLQTGKFSSDKAADFEDSNDSNQSELLLQSGKFSSDKAADFEDSNDSNQSELLLQTGNYQSLIEEDSDEVSTSFVYSEIIEGTDNINFTKLRGKNQKNSCSEVDQPSRRTARNMFSGVMFPNDEISDLWTKKSTTASSSGSLASTPLIARNKLSDLNKHNQSVLSPGNVHLDSPIDSPFIRQKESPNIITPGFTSVGNNSQWSEVDEDLLMNLEDIDEGENSNQNPVNVSSSPPFSENNTFDNSDFNDELSAACYLLERSQRLKGSEGDNKQISDRSFTHLNGHSNGSNLLDGTGDLSMLLSPTKRRSTTCLDSPVTPKKVKNNIPDSNLLVSPARRLLTQLSIDLDED